MIFYLNSDYEFNSIAKDPDPNIETLACACSKPVVKQRLISVSI
ncbi:MAG: hypothetical protein Sylvanvirus5_16 [Sylvanvirus sp.]|uniref:Uncharacterized protein n=1 Tax=Sylvanvirus sp. TaxID=2487774 RepID=A0A3G5AHM8_9VIRU|nr:MAG: hypothetical protein Sylvanvirus5_16 [Sylvanvirus sp.]